MREKKEKGRERGDRMREKEKGRERGERMRENI